MARKDYIVGSGNVFEDLGHPRPADALAKAELAGKIAALIAKRGLTQGAAAKVLQVDQPKGVGPGPGPPRWVLTRSAYGYSCCSAATWRSSLSRALGRRVGRGC